MNARRGLLVILRVAVLCALVAGLVWLVVRGMPANPVTALLNALGGAK